MGFLAGKAPLYLNGRLLRTVVRYRLDVEIVDGKRKAAGLLVFVVLREKQEVDFNELLRQPFQLQARAGSVVYALEQVQADGEPFACADCLVDGEWLAVEAKEGEVLQGLRFHSDQVHRIEDVG